MINFKEGSAGRGFSERSDMPESFPFSPGKMLEETEDLTGPQVTAYMFMLAICHQHGGIPNDASRLRVMYGRKFPIGDIRVVMACMVPDPDNQERLLHPHYVLWKEDGSPERGEV